MVVDLYRFWKCPTPAIILYLDKSEIRLQVEWGCHIWAVATESLRSNYRRIKNNYADWRVTTYFPLYNTFQIDQTSHNLPLPYSFSLEILLTIYIR